VIPISRTRIIHSFFRPKTAAVNKFRLLSFGKISFDRKISVAAHRQTAAIFRKTKAALCREATTPFFISPRLNLKIPKGFNHSARRCPMQSGYAG